MTEDDVAGVVAEWTKVPVQRLKESESARLQKLEQTLHKRVIGQDEAVSAVAKAVRRGRVGLKDPKRPIGSFCFSDRPVLERRSYQRHWQKPFLEMKKR